MSYTTDLGSNPFVIDDGNFDQYAQAVADGEFASGYEARDYRAHPLGSVAEGFSGEIIPRSKWDDLIKMQEDNQSSHGIRSKATALNSRSEWFWLLLDVRNGSLPDESLPSARHRD